ncbi:MAG: DUF1684 domain-containing protein [Propionibacteriaceae bacterium]|jgi:thiosulfate/3-mercaptopyruvate sulfurtransferase|nr:DUF1684 domain-containing protein [Propionibacteriaceae bacterium]
MTSDWPDGYVEDWQAWRRRRWAEAPGIAANVGTWWPSPTPELVPGRPGRWWADGQKLCGDQLTRPEAEIDLAARPGPDLVELAAGQSVEVDGRRFQALAMRDALALRLFDPAAPSAADLVGLDALEPDPAWIKLARFVPAEPGRTTLVEHVDGWAGPADLAGWAELELGGRTRRLELTPAGRGYFLVFGDASNGRQTKQYRFLLVEPAVQDQVRLDFNRAYLPPISFSTHYLCPRPTAANRLDCPVLAGETFQRYADRPDWPLVEAGRLAGDLAAGAGVRLLDVRWRLGWADNWADYLSGHLPGAVWVDLDDELADPARPEAGRHPLPGPERLQAAARRWGLEPGDQVVVYDDGGNMAAARAWWVLTDAGFEVRLLDGGLAAWREQGYALDTGQVRPPPSQIRLDPPGRLPRLEIEQAADFPAHGVLLDARAEERYLGLTEPVDARAGHIPGALSAPTGDNLDPSGRFRPADQLRARFAALGIEPDTDVAVYCGSGVTAAHEILALRLAGFKAALYAGSWSQWAASDRPAAQGREPAQSGRA